MEEKVAFIHFGGFFSRRLSDSELCLPRASPTFRFPAAADTLLREALHKLKVVYPNIPLALFIS